MVSGRMREIAKSIYEAIPLKPQLYEVIRRGPSLPQKLYQHLHFEGPFEVRVDSDHRFRIHSYGTYVENELFWSGFGGSWECTSLKIWAALCRSLQGMAIDIGANTGVYALAAASLGAEVIAFEPVDRMARRLRQNIALNNFPIRVEQMAVSDRTGRLTIYDDLTEHNYSASLEGQGPDATSYKVDACTLDDFLGDVGLPTVGVVKIDVERHEPAVLRGMYRTLAEQRPAMLVEILDSAIGEDVGQLLDGLGYRIYHIDERKGLIPATVPAPLGNHNWNHLVCTAERFERAEMAGLLAADISP